MLNVNEIKLAGRMVKDVEMKTTKDGKSVASYRLAVDKRIAGGEKKTEFFNVTTWGKVGEALAKNCGKGSEILVEGRLVPRSYEDAEGNKHYMMDVVADHVTYVSIKKPALVA